MKRFLDFVNDAIYDLLIRGQANAEANGRDIIQPWVARWRRARRVRAAPAPAGRPGPPPV
jgi:hypothetical protein